MRWILPLGAALLLPTVANAQVRAVATPPPPPERAMSGYMKIGDIKGESTDTADAKHDKWITIESAHFATAGMAQAAHADFKEFTFEKKSDMGSAAASQQRSRGDTTLGDVVVVRELDKSSLVMLATGRFDECNIGENIGTMEVGTGKQTYILHDVEVVGCSKSWSTSGDADDRPTEKVAMSASGTSGDADDRPTEEVAFYYNKIAFSYSKRDIVMKGKKILQN